MLGTKENALRSIINSESGVHVTVYLENSRDEAWIQDQMRNAISVATECLSPVCDPATTKKLLDPLQKILLNPKLVMSIRGNIGIFRTINSFRIVRLPVEVNHLCVVSTSFHVKPLLRWIQGDQDFLLLAFDSPNAYLYFGNQSKMELVESFLLTNTSAQSASGQGDSGKDFFDDRSSLQWIDLRIRELTKKSRPNLYLVGGAASIRAYQKVSTYSQLIKHPLSDKFDLNSLEKIHSLIRNNLIEYSKLRIESALLEYRWADQYNLARKNIFQIAKAVIAGQVRRLIVAEDIEIFGKIDQKSGGLSIHPAHLDHEDDDILDDLAQRVLRQGGEVITVPKDKIPKGRPILAVLKSPPPLSFNQKSDNNLALAYEQKGVL